ncbi:MAG: GAF domain-containing protein [Chloroflexia bacterium]
MTPEDRSRVRAYAFLGLGLLVALGGWAALLLTRPIFPAEAATSWLLFLLLSLLIKGLGSRVVPRETHSLVGIVDLAALLLFGIPGGAWVAGSGALLYQAEQALVQMARARREGKRPSLLLPAANLLFDSGLKVAMALAGGYLYILLGGRFPPLPLEVATAWPAFPLFLAWFALDHLGWALAEAVLGGWWSVGEWFRAVIGPSLFLELFPLPLSLLVVVTYRQSTAAAFALTAAGLIGTSLVIQRLVAVAAEQRRSARELAALNEAAQAIVQAEMSVEGLCELIYEQAGRVVDTSIFHLGLIEGDRLTLQIWVVDGVRQEPLTVTLRPGEGIVGWMRESKRPLLVRDFQREMERLPARPRYLSPRPPRSAVFVPLIARGEVIGSLSIQSYRPSAFTEQHLRILSFIAHQAAVAIEKARLYEAVRQRAAELERIAAENASLYAQVREERDRVELLYDIGRDLTRRLDPDDLLRRLLQRTRESVRAESGSILLLGTRRDPPRAISIPDEEHGALQTVLKRGLAGWVIQNRQGALLGDVGQDPRWLPTGRPVGSAISVPILHRETAWGAITLTHPQRDFFTPADLALLSAIAEQAAVALEAARLYEAQRRRAVQLQTIAQVLRSILSILDLDRLLTEVVHLIRERFGYAHVHIFTLDSTTGEAVFRASTDPDSPFWQQRGGRLSLDEGLVGWVARQGEAAIVGDVHRDPRWLPDQSDVTSEVAVPLKVAGQVVGVLDVQSDEAEAFDAEDAFILRTLADQLAMALENARLYQAQQEEAWVLNALLQVAQNIAQAPDLEELLEVAVRLVPILVGVERVVLLLREREEDVFQAVKGYGVPEALLPEMRYTPAQVPVFGRAVRQAVPVTPVGPEEENLPPPLDGALGEGSRWFYPLLVGGEVIGLLGLGLEPPAVYLSARQHTILTGLANQAGIAIEEARLRRAASERQRLEQELAVARELQRSLLPPSGPEVPGWSVEVAWQAARQVGGDFYDFIPLSANRLGLVIADVSDKGVPAALFMVLSRSLLRASASNHRSPAEALRHANQLLLQDNRAEMFVSVFYGVIDLESGEMRYASAGHNPPLLCRREGGILSLEAPGIILGVLPEVHLEERSVRLEAGDTLVLYTDGVTEAINRQEEQFGEERLQETLCAHRGRPLAELRQALLDTLEAFTEGQPPFDDITLVLVRREVERPGERSVWNGRKSFHR